MVDYSESKRRKFKRRARNGGERKEKGRKEERKEGVKVRNRVQSCRTHVAEVLKDTG